MSKLVFQPSLYSRVADTTLTILADAVDPAIMRGVGVLAVTLGGYLIYLGLWVV